MKVVIIGAAGTIGKHITAALTGEGHDIIKSADNRVICMPT